MQPRICRRPRSAASPTKGWFWRAAPERERELAPLEPEQKKLNMNPRAHAPLPQFGTTDPGADHRLTVTLVVAAPALEPVSSNDRRCAAKEGRHRRVRPRPPHLARATA